MVPTESTINLRYLKDSALPKLHKFMKPHLGKFSLNILNLIYLVELNHHFYKVGIFSFSQLLSLASHFLHLLSVQ